MMIDEFDLIARRFRPLAASFPGALRLEDDAALIAPSPGCELAVSADALVAGVHFFASDPPDLIARKALRVNFSDIAAMGGRVRAVMLALCLPQTVSHDWTERFCDGLAEDLSFWSVPLIGGDTVTTPGPLTLAVTVFGDVPAGRALRRSAARDGDDLWISGTVGDAALGLQVCLGTLTPLSGADRDWLVSRYHLPQPRLALAPHLLPWTHALMDVSDGLLADCGHICKASGLAAQIRTDWLPLSAAAAAILAQDSTADHLATVLTGGDDYELLLSAPVSSRETLQALAQQTGIMLTRIGQVTQGDGVQVINGAGETLTFDRTGWRHQCSE